MSDAASTETTAVETPAATEVPAVQTASAHPGAEQTSAAEAEAPAADDYSWVPPKFLVDGKPDAKALAKSYQALEKKLGSKVINLAPEDLAEYDYTPTKFEFDPEGVTAFKTKAKELGLTTAQYQALLGEYEQSMEKVLPSVERSEADLKQAWGKDFNTNLNAAYRAFAEFAPSDLSMDDPSLNTPAVLKLLARIGADLSEDQAPNGGVVSGTTKTEIDELMAGNKHFDDPVAYKKVSDWFAKNVQ